MGCTSTKNKQNESIEEKKVSKKSVENNEDFAEFDLIFYHKLQRDYLSIKIELFFSCMDLYKFNRSQKANSMLVLYSYSDKNELIEEGRTEVIRDAFNPVFIKTFILNYRFHSTNDNVQKYLCQVFYVEDIDNAEDLSQNKLLGQAEFVLGNLITLANQEIELNLTNKEFSDIKLGKVRIKAVEKEENSEFISFKLGIKGKLSKRLLACKIFHKKSYQEYLPIYVTKEVRQISSTFFWDSVELPINSLKQVDKGDNKIRFQIYEVQKNDKIKVLAQIDIANAEFLKFTKTELPLNPGKKDKKTLIISELKKYHKFKLFDFLVSKIDINTFFFLDMTNSIANKEYLKQSRLMYEKRQLDNSKQYEGTNNYNDEEIVIKTKVQPTIFNKIEYIKVSNQKKNDSNTKQLLKINSENKEVISGEIKLLYDTLIKFITDFDTDNRYPVFGFGSMFPPTYECLVNCFSLTKDMMNPEISGDMIYETFSNILKEVKLYGPAVLCESMDLFLKFLKNNIYTPNFQFYAIAVFVVSSPVIDLLEFLSKTDEASDYPCSIVVISLGNEVETEELEYLNILDKEKLYNKLGKPQITHPKRKNTYYINFHELQNSNPNIESEAVLKPILRIFFKEIANQFIEYINMKNIHPIEFENLKLKSLHNYMEHRKMRQFNKYVTPEYLTIEKESLLDDIKKVGYCSNDLERTFNKYIPTFERHYIINCLNNFKVSNKAREIHEERSNIPTDKEYILFNGKLLIDERKQIKVPSKKFGILNSSDIKQIKNSEGKHHPVPLNNSDNVICNVCNENKINIVFQECKHRYCCEYCVDDNIKNCPFCNKKIKSFVKVYNV